MHRRQVLATAAGLALTGCAPARRLFDDWTVDGDEDGYWVYDSHPDDTLIGLAQSFDLGFVELAAANPDIDAWVIPENTPLRVPRFHLLPESNREGVVINVGDMRLYYFDSPHGVVDFPIGIGRDGHLTPLGETRVVRRKARPTWYPPTSVRKERPELGRSVPPGPDNPLGEYALYLDWPQYLIHGTNVPASVGRRASNGCIRLYPNDIAYLFETTPDGLAVEVVEKPVKAAWIDDRLYMEAHPSQAQATEIEEKGSFTPGFDDSDVAMIDNVAGPAGVAINWHLVETSLIERRGYPIRLA
jgi:L,D-transpeptidase ErfK/SrfK